MTLYNNILRIQDAINRDLNAKGIFEDISSYPYNMGLSIRRVPLQNHLKFLHIQQSHYNIKCAC